MEMPKLNINNFRWYTQDLVCGDQDASFECPSCGAESHFSPNEAARKIPKATGQLQPVGQTVRLTGGFALFVDQIPDRQPLTRGLSIVIGIVTVILVLLLWQHTIFEEGIPGWALLLAFFGGWAVTRLVQPAMSPKLPLWRFSCAECGAGYVLATNGIQARIGDNKGRIVDGPTSGNQTHSPVD